MKQQTKALRPTLAVLVSAIACAIAAHAASFDTHLSKAETDKLGKLVEGCTTAECFKQYSDDFFDRSEKNLAVALQGIPKTLQAELRFGSCYKKGVYATELIACERRIINTVQTQVQAIDTSQPSMAGAVMPGAVTTLAVQSCMPDARNDSEIDAALRDAKTNQCVKDTVVSLQKRMTDARAIANASDMQNRRAMVVNKLCFKAVASAKAAADAVTKLHKAGKAVADKDLNTGSCQGEESRADIMALRLHEALTGPAIALDAEIAKGAPGLAAPGQDGPAGSLESLYEGRHDWGIDGGVHCPSFIPRTFCGGTKYDPRKYKESSNDDGVLVYDDKTAVPDNLFDIKSIMSSVYDGALGELFKKDLAEHTATRAIENALQTAALDLDTEGFNGVVDELGDAAACLPSYTDRDKVKKMAAAIPLEKNTSSPKNAQAQADYRANMAIAAQCANTIGKRTSRLRREIGLDTKPVGPWISPEDLKASFGTVGGFLAELALGFHPGVSLIVFNNNFVHASDLVAAKCSMLNEHQSLEVRNQCRDIKYEFALETNELDVLMNQYSPLAETYGGGQGYEAIVAAGGVDQRLASYDLDPYHARKAGEETTDENGDMIFCMERAKRLGIQPSPKALEVAGELVKGTVKKQIDGFKKEIAQACANPTAVAADAIQDPSTMEEYFNCNRPRFGNVEHYLDLKPSEIAASNATLSDSECKDRLSSSIAACYFYRQVQGSNALKNMSKEVAIHAASLALDAVGVIGYAGMAKSLAQVGLRKLFSKMAVQALKDSLTVASLGKAAATGIAFGMGTTVVQGGVQKLSGSSVDQLGARTEAEQQRLRGGTGTYDNLLAARQALEDASSRHPYIESLVKGAAAGVLFSVGLAPAEGAAAGAHGVSAPHESTALSPEVMQAARETFPQLWVDLEKSGAFKDPKMAKQLDGGMRPIMKSLLAQADPKLKPDEIEKLPTTEIAKRVREINQTEAAAVPELQLSQADGAAVAPQAKILDVEAVAKFDASKGDPEKESGLIEAATRVIKDLDPDGEIPDDAKALFARAQELSKERLETIEQSVAELRDIDLEAGDLVSGDPKLKANADTMLAMYKSLKDKGNSETSIRKLLERLTKECPIGPAAIAEMFRDCGVLVL